MEELNTKKPTAIHPISHSSQSWPNSEQIPQFCDWWWLPSQLRSPGTSPFSVGDLDHPHSLSLHCLWLQLYFPNFPPKTESMALASRLPQALCCNAKIQCLVSTVGKNTPRKYNMTSERKPEFLKFDSKKTERLWTGVWADSNEEREEWLFQGCDWFLKDAFIILKMAKTRRMSYLLSYNFHAVKNLGGHCSI